MPEGPKPTPDLPILSEGGNPSEVELEERYWKTKLLYNAVESVLYGPSQTTFEPEILQRLRLAFHGDEIIGESEENTTISFDVKSLLSTLVSQEITCVVDTLIKSSTDLLIDSPTDSNKLEDRLEEIVHAVEKRKKEDDELNQEIQQLEQLRKAGTEIFESRINEVTLDLENLMKKASILKDPELMNKKLEELKSRCAVLTVETEIAKKQQFQAENPPELTAEVQTTKLLVSAAMDELRNEISTKAEFLKKYESLTPDVVKLITELKNTEEGIQRQEWMKEKLTGFNTSSSDVEISFNESFTDF